MTRGLPVTTWLLLVLSVGPALIIVFRFWSRARSIGGRTGDRDRDDADTGGDR